MAASDAKSLCQMPKPTEINVSPRTEEVTYDYSKPRDALQDVAIDTVDPYGFDQKTHTNGYMKGLITMEPRVKMDYKHIPKYDAVCIWYDVIDLKIEIDPEIVIAKEIAENPCKLSAVKKHELQHVKVDRQIVNKYGASMGQKIYDGLKQRGFMVGPIRAEHAQDVVKKMQMTVGRLVELEYRKMEIERQERQQAVDNLDEYERVNKIVNACPDRKSRTSGASRGR